MPTSPPVETNLVVGNWDGLPITFGNEVDHLFLLVKVMLGFCLVLCYDFFRCYYAWTFTMSLSTNMPVFE